MKKEKIHGKTIIEWETELSKLNRKSLNISKFKEYIQKKSEINGLLFAFYETYIFRKLRLQSYRNTKKSEQKMIINFKRVFGNEKEVVVCFGDYEQKQQMKYKEATKGKGMRTLFRKAGFQTYLVDEFRTSCKCSKCGGGVCEKFMVRTHPNKKKNKDNEEGMENLFINMMLLPFSAVNSATQKAKYEYSKKKEEQDKKDKEEKLKKETEKLEKKHQKEKNLQESISRIKNLLK